MARKDPKRPAPEPEPDPEPEPQKGEGLPDQAARDARDDEIVAARLRGLSWDQIGRTYGITGRRVRQIMAAWRKTNPPLRTADPLDIVDEMLEQYQGAAEELSLISATTKSDSNRVGAIRARIDVLRQMTELLQAVGVLPNDLGKLRVDLDVRFVAETIITVLEAEGVSHDVQARLMEALERGGRPELTAGNGASTN